MRHSKGREALIGMKKNFGMSRNLLFLGSDFQPVMGNDFQSNPFNYFVFKAQSEHNSHENLNFFLKTFTRKSYEDL